MNISRKKEAFYAFAGYVLLFCALFPGKPGITHTRWDMTTGSP